MKCLSLNIRGFGGPTKVKKLRDLLSKEAIEFLAIQETLIKGDASFVISLFWKHSQWSFCQLPSSGRSGGLLCVWNTSIFTAENIISGSGYLGVEGFWHGCSNKILLCNIYGPQDTLEKKALWNSLLAIKSSSTAWWCIMGDFNVVRCAEEREGCSFNLTRATDFNNFINAAQLIEPLLGAKRFTWIGYGGSKLSKLDRFLLSKEFYDI